MVAIEQGLAQALLLGALALSGERGAPPRNVDDRVYETIEEAYHAVFLLRVNDLLES